MRNTIMVIDVGTSKIVATVAQSGVGARTDILGMGSVRYDGYSGLNWNNPAELYAKMGEVIRRAEEQARVRANKIYLGVPATFTQVYATRESVQIQGVSPRVTMKEINALFDKAEQSIQHKEGLPINRDVAWFSVDQGKHTFDPLNVPGSEISAMVAFAKADQVFIDEIGKLLEQNGRRLSGVYSTPVGQCMLYIPQDERDKVSALIDIGYLCTDVMIVEGDAVVSMKTVPIGGGHIAADLAYGLEIPLEAAETLKRSYRFDAKYTQAAFEVIIDNQRVVTFQREKVEEVLLPRIDELCEEIDKALDDGLVRLSRWSVMYMTGGGLAINDGSFQYVSGQLGRPLRPLQPKSQKMNSPIYTSSLGLVNLVADSQQDGETQGVIASFFRRLFGG